MTDTEDTPLRHRFVWVSICSTGLDPEAGDLLEVHVAVVDDAPGGDFGVVDEIGTALYAPTAESVCDDFVLKMHTTDGLLGEAKSTDNPTAEQLDYLLADYFAGSLGAEPGRLVVLAGDSIEFTTRWIAKHLPRTRALTAPQSLDVTSLVIAANAYQPRLLHGLRTRAKKPTRAKEKCYQAVYKASVLAPWLLGGKP